MLNGRLPASALAPIAGGRLRRDCAALWNAMNVARRARGQATILPTGPNASYRTVAGQIAMRRMWCARGRCANAAPPGTSNHGLGTVVDTGNAAGAYAYGGPFGIRKAFSDAPWEPWHVVIRPSAAQRRPAVRTSGRRRTLRRGSKGRDVWTLQIYLRRAGYLKVSRAGFGFGAEVERAVRAFQRRVGLKPDGEVGPQTFAALKRRYSTNALRRRK